MTDQAYIYGYFAEMNPMRVRLAFLNAGLVCPEFGAACELGFGQGLSVNFHASASVTTWYGTDFNPAHAGYAQEIASVSGSNAHLYDEAFDEFAMRELPEFDYIALHGVWSWISAENRQVIVDFIRKKLKVGGVLYISYNTLPGWGAFAPMRHLMNEHAKVIGKGGKGIFSSIDSALDFSEKLLETNPLFACSNTLVADRVAKMRGQNRQYLVHEYFVDNWHPMHFSEVANLLYQAKLSFACSANYLEHVDSVNLTVDQQSFLKDIKDPIFRQTVLDFMVNQQFRKDYWVKGERQLNALEKVEMLRSECVVLTTHLAYVEFKVSGALGELPLTEQVITPVLNVLSDYKPHRIGELEKAIMKDGLGFVQLIETIMLLTGLGHLHSVQSDDVVEKVKKQTDLINKRLILKSRVSSDISYLASPLTGGGIYVPRFAQLFLLAQQQGKKMPDEWAQFVWQMLSPQGQKIVKEGKTLETDADNLKELTTQAHEFAARQMPILMALQIA
jgi:SAM-dependent methyltransferase